MRLSSIYKGKENNYDFIRFFLAVLVLYAHSFALYSDQGLSQSGGELIFNITNGQLYGGYLAVNMFFLISGFLITMSWHNAPNFYYFTSKRILRIVPGLVGLFIFTILIVGPILSKEFGDYFGQLSFSSVSYDFFNMSISVSTMNNMFMNLPKDTINGSLWTLKYEVYCYIIVLLLGMFKLLNKAVVTSLFLFLFIMYMSQLYVDLELSRAVPMPRLGTYFLLGSMYFLYKEYIIFNRQIITFTLLLSVLLIWIGFAEIAVLFLFSFLLFAIIYSSKFALHNFAKHGDFSYGMYIYAFFVQQLTLYTFTDVNFYLFIFISLFVSIFLAFISWHLIEKPSLRLAHSQKIKKFFAYKSNYRGKN